MSQSFTTEIEQMGMAASLTMQVKDTVYGELLKTWSELSAVMDSWKGEASNSFQALKDRWDFNAKALNETLGQIAEAIDRTKVQYQEAEAQGRDDFRSITANLD